MLGKISGPILLLFLLPMPLLISKIFYDGINKRYYFWLLLYTSVTMSLLFYTLLAVDHLITEAQMLCFMICNFNIPILPWVIYAYKKSISNNRYILLYKCIYYMVFLTAILSLWVLCVN